MRENRPPFAHRLPAIPTRLPARRHQRLRNRRRQHLDLDTRVRLEEARRRPPSLSDGQREGEKVQRAVLSDDDRRGGQR